MKTVKTILDNNRNPLAAGDVSHAYGDKYLLANFSVNTANAATLNALDTMGLDSKGLSQLQDWAGSRSVTLRLESLEQCKFLRETKRDVDSATKNVSTLSVGGRDLSSVTHKTVTTITEYFWQFDVEWSLFAFKGNDPTDKLELQQDSGRYEVKTTNKSSPRPVRTVVPVKDINITWLLQQLDQDKHCAFSIDRSDAKKCHTPRRNEDIDKAMAFYQEFARWCREVDQYVRSFWSVQRDHAISFNDLGATSVFVPILPLFEARSADSKDGKADTDMGDEKKALVAVQADELAVGRPVLSLGDINAFLCEQRRTLSVLFGGLDQTFPDDGQLVTRQPAR
jgi:hypothetical protein